MAKGSGGGGRGSRNVAAAMQQRSIAAENKYRGWLNRQPEAVAEVSRIVSTSRTITSDANRRKYLRREKAAFDSKWVERYSASRKR